MRRILAGFLAAVLFCIIPYFASAGECGWNLEKSPTIEELMGKGPIEFVLSVQRGNDLVWITALSISVGGTRVSSEPYDGSDKFAVSVDFDTWKNAVYKDGGFLCLDVTLDETVTTISDISDTFPSVIGQYKWIDDSWNVAEDRNKKAASVWENDDPEPSGKSAAAVWEDDDDEGEPAPYETPRAEAVLPEIPGLKYNKYTDCYEANGDFRVDRNLDLGGRGLKILNGKLFIRKGGALINCGTIFCDSLKIENGGALYSVNGSICCESGEFTMERNAYATGLDSVFCRSMTTREESRLQLTGDIIARNEKKEYGDVQLNGSLSGVNRIECKSFSVNKTARVETAINVLKCHQDLNIRNGKDSAVTIIYLDQIPGEMHIENNSVLKLVNNSLLQVDGNTNIEGVVHAASGCVLVFSNELKIRNSTQISCRKIQVKGNLTAETELIGKDRYSSGTVQLIKNKADKYVNLDVNEIIVDGKVEYKGDFSVKGTIRMTAEKPQFKIKWLSNGAFDGTLCVGKAEVTSMKDDKITFRDLDVEADCLKAETELVISKGAQKDLENKAKSAAKKLFDSYHLIHTADGETATLKWEGLYDDIIEANLVTIDVPDESEAAAAASIRDGFDLTDWGWGTTEEYKDLAYQLLEKNLPYQNIKTVEHFNGIGQQSTKVMDITYMNCRPELTITATINGKKGKWHLEGGILERTGALYLKSDTGETISFTCTYNLDKAEKAAEDLQKRGIKMFQEKQKEALKSIVKEAIKPYEAGIASIVAETRDGLADAASSAIYKLTGGAASEAKDKIVKSIQDNPGVDLVADVYKTFREFESSIAATAASGGNSMNTIYSTMKSNTKKQFEAEKQKLYKEYINPNGK